MLIYSFVTEGLSVNVYDSIDDEIILEWKKLSRHDLLPSYLKFLEESKPLDLTFRYSIIKRIISGEVVSIIYLQKLNFSAKNFRVENSPLLSLITKLGLRIRHFRVLICGNLFAVNFTSIEPAGELITLHQINSVFSEIEKKEKADLFILNDLPESFAKDKMEAFQWKPYATDLTMELKIRKQWKSMDDYVSSLSKKYRKRAIKIIESGRKMIRTELNADEIKKNENEIMSLFNQVSSKQNIRMGLISDHYFYDYKINFPEIFQFIGYYFNGRMIGFATYVNHDDGLEAHYIGIDYRLNDDFKIYFNILFDSLNKAIVENKNVLELGRTAREAKANLGAQPVFFNDFFRTGSSIVTRLINYFENNFQKKMGTSWNDKNPFKD